MKEAIQYDINLDSQRFISLLDQGKSSQAIESQKTYVGRQINTDIGERLDVWESHFVYEIKDEKLYGQGEVVPFEEVMGKGLFGDREKAELAGYKLGQEYLVNAQDGDMIFNPSSPGGPYKKNYLDVHRRVGNEVHSVRYFSTLSNQEYREKIILINPNYQQLIPENPTDMNFFLNPVIVPSYLKMNPDQLARFVLDGKKGMEKEELERIMVDIAPVTTSYINTLAEHPEDLYSLDSLQKAIYAAAYKSRNEGEYKPTYDLPRMEIVYLAQQKETLRGGGCGSGSCSTNGFSSASYAGEISFSPDGKGPLEFKCPSCGEKNTRPFGDYVYRCKNTECKNPEAVLPPGLRSIKAKLN